MKPLNSFIQSNMDSMKKFLDTICDDDDDNVTASLHCTTHRSQIQKDIEAGHQLAILQRMLHKSDEAIQAHLAGMMKIAVGDKGMEQVMTAMREVMKEVEILQHKVLDFKTPQIMKRTISAMQ